MRGVRILFHILLRLAIGVAQVFLCLLLRLEAKSQKLTPRVRLEILHQWLEPVAKFIWEETRSSFKPIKGQDNSDRLTKYITDVTLTVSVAVHGDKDAARNFPQLPYLFLVMKLQQFLSPKSLHDSIDLSDLRLACANADPNYGSL